MKLLEILNTMVMIGLASMMYNVHTYYTSFFDKKTGIGATRRSNLNEKLAQELRKSVIEKFKIRKVMSGLNIIFGQQI